LQQTKEATNIRRAREEARYTPIEINFNNVVADPQRTARVITNTLTKQRSISGVRVTAPSGFF